MRRWRIVHKKGRNAIVNGNVQIYFDKIVDTDRGKELYLGDVKIAELGHEEVIT